MSLRGREYRALEPCLGEAESALHADLEVQFAGAWGDGLGPQPRVKTAFAAQTIPLAVEQDESGACRGGPVHIPRQ